MPRVLYVGHDRELAEVTGRILKRHQYRTQLVIGIEDAEHALLTQVFDLVVLDCETTKEERGRFYRTVQKQENVPCLLLISGSREDEIPALNEGADDWMKKPYRVEVLLARMAALLRQNGKRTISHEGVGY